MDPVNILIALNFIATMGANLTGAKKGFKSSLGNAKERPGGFLQNIPPNFSALVFIFIILGIFRIATAVYDNSNFPVRCAGLSVFVVFSWIQIFSFKTLGEFYSQDIVILKNHKIIKTGLYRYLRHPQYVCQILADLGAVAAVLSYPAALLVLIEIPLLVLRAKEEDKLFGKYFNEEFSKYKKETGFFLPKFPGAH